MINTYNESNLHHTLKNIYSMENNGKTEEQIGPWICDIVTNERNIIEIQTSNVSKLRNKILYLLNAGYGVTIVHPIVNTKYIEWYNCDNVYIGKRKSPKSETLYAALRQLTGIYDLLLNKNFTLELIDISLSEQRLKTKESIQLTNKSRRFLRPWKPIGKKLIEIKGITRFTKANDYYSLIPDILKEPFTAKDLETSIHQLSSLQCLSEKNRTLASSQASLLIWIFSRMKLITNNGKRGNARTYIINK